MKRITFIALVFLGALSCGHARRWVPKISASGPVMVASDNFDSYLNNDVLSSEPNWSSNQGQVTVFNPIGAGSVFGDTAAFCFYSGAAFSANQRAEGTLVGISAGSSFVVLSVRGDTGGAATGYTFFADGANYYVIDYISGAQNVITSGALTGLSAGSKLSIDASGTGSATRLKIQKNTAGSWVDIATNIDPGTSHYIDGGKPGVGGQSNVVGFQFTDWSGWNL